MIAHDDSPAKDKPNTVGKLALKESEKNEALEKHGCKKLGALFEKTTNQKIITAGRENQSLFSLPSNPSLQSSKFQNEDLNLLKLSREHSTQKPKFKLKLFPLDETTQKRMEEDNHYPYLELTITPKKKIASVIRHLTVKWGNLKNALEEELVLFPYNNNFDGLENYKRWSLMDAGITTAEVYVAIGKPAVFRLRYGWLNILGLKFSSMTCHIPPSESIPSENLKNDVGDCEKEVSLLLSGPLPDELRPKQDAQEMSHPLKKIRTLDNQMQSSQSAKLSWIDCESNISFGALISQVEANEEKLCLQAAPMQVSMSFDSFDAAIAAHIARYPPVNQIPTIFQPSILDAEETCNPFSFRSFTSLSKNSRVQSGVNPTASINQDEKIHMMESHNSPCPTAEPSQDGCCVATLMTKNEEMQPSSSTGAWQFLASSQPMTTSDSNGIASTSPDLH